MLYIDWIYRWNRTFKPLEWNKNQKGKTKCSYWEPYGLSGKEKIDNLTVLSLCDGMSCGQIALVEEGFTIKKYYASEREECNKSNTGKFS